jgi:hypothetical protein
MITRMLLASVLAIGAGSFAGCGDTDCPAATSAGTSCSSAGLTCFNGAGTCTCNNGSWSCTHVDDLPAPVPRDMLPARDLPLPTD